MIDAPTIRCEVGLKASQDRMAAQLYDEAFGKKFRIAIESRTDRIALFETSFTGHYAIAASEGDNLVGLAGLHTPKGSLTGGLGARQLFERLGALRGLRAIAIFSLYERKPKPGELLMDGIAVHKDYRGRGVGSQLLKAVLDYGKSNGFRTVRLDVIDTNSGARRLYERRGFVPTRVEKFPYLRWLLGFGASTTMEFRLTDANQKDATVDINGEIPEVVGHPCTGLVLLQVWEGRTLTDQVNVAYLRFGELWFRLYFEPGTIFWRQTEAPEQPENSALSQGLVLNNLSGLEAMTGQTVVGIDHFGTGAQDVHVEIRLDNRKKLMFVYAAETDCATLSIGFGDSATARSTN